MRTIYIDSEFKCHTTNIDGTMTPTNTAFFDRKCDAFIEGYCYDINKKAIYPWKDYSELDAAQSEYEKQLLLECEANLAELDSLVLNLQYNNLIAE